MEIKELRIGNWVRVDGQNVMITHIALDSPVEVMEPIPLTEELLLKCGFMLRGETYMLNGVLVELNKYESEDDTFKLDFEVYVESGSYIRDVETLHQLQNLYFAVTGREIDLKWR